MHNFSTELFFNTQGFAHKKLFSLNTFVWDALHSLETYFSSDEVIYGKDCKIGPNVLIEGPCIIGDRCEIRHGAYIRGGCVIGDDCVIGHATELVRSIVLNGAKLPHFNYVGDSIIGCGVNVGAGGKCANVRLDKGEVVIFYRGSKYPTKRKKMGAIIGDGASIGCNAVLNPGTIVFPKILIPPCQAVKGVIE